MGKLDLFRAWGRILAGEKPTLSIEVTRECPLRCPGCYAYEEDHLGDAGPLRSLADFRGDDLVRRVMALVDEQRPVHVSIVGGEPLVRHRELDRILPRLAERKIITQVVTSAVRPIPAEWRGIPKLWISVSIDGLQPEHDARRAPATYERILKNVAGHAVTVHCTVTSQMARRPGAFEEFARFWSARDEVQRIWFSLFTPQVGDDCEEILDPPTRRATIDELARLRSLFPKLVVPDAILDGYRQPPSSPDDCIFARTTTCLTADLKTRVTPCQFGGEPDCAQCGCMASAGIKSIADVRLLGVVPIGSIYRVSERVGRRVKALRPEAPVARTDRDEAETEPSGRPSPVPLPD